MVVKAFCDHCSVNDFLEAKKESGLEGIVYQWQISKEISEKYRKDCVTLGDDNFICKKCLLKLIKEFNKHESL